MKLKVINRYYHTIKYLKSKQIVYGIYYRLRNLILPFLFELSATPKKTADLTFDNFPNTPTTFLPDRTFIFLNQKHRFKHSIDWNYARYGKLWTYHLTYFDYLHQSDMNRTEGLELIQNFIRQQQKIKDGMEPYPISLRGVNWIKFLSKHQVQDSEIDKSLFNQYQLLSQRIEYHLMGNHLLENGLSLLFGAFYFEDSDLLKESKKILFDELEEQILDDGAHFERSPMYHLILLNRLLDTLNLVTNNKGNKSYSADLELLLLNKIKRMLDWFRQIRFSSGKFPACNDSTNKAPINPDETLEYGNRLGLDGENVKQTQDRVGESGYRIVKKHNYELFIDAGKPGPDYIPGHAHCDVFSFVLYVDHIPFIVDPGVSTYEEGKVRMRERSTAAHNTVMLDEIEQSDIWKAFRVGRRAEVEILEDNESMVSGSHDGYKQKSIIHKRTFRWDITKIVIEDVMEGKTDLESRAFLHFHPDRSIIADIDNITVDNKIAIKFDGAVGLNLDYYQYAHDFNDTEQAQRIEIIFKEKLITKIELP